MASRIPAGWYPDPQQPGVERRWDGHQWSSKVRSADSSAGSGRRGRVSAKVVAAVGKLSRWRPWLGWGHCRGHGLTARARIRAHLPDPGS